MSAAAGGESFTEYIQHHLTFWTHPVAAGGGFWSVNFDSLLVSVLVGVVFLGWFGWFARRASSGVPSKTQAFVELVIEFVDGQVKDAWHGPRAFLGPLALTIFVWVLMMNLLDLLPVDLLPRVAEGAGAAHFRPVPTADVNMTFAMGITVLALTLFFGFKAKGFGGFIKEKLTEPFTSTGIVAKVILAPVNLLMAIIEYFAQPVSLSLRLFGNIFAGELLFMLIAGLMSHWLSIWYPLGILGYAIWTLFEFLIVLIQAFIFMYLAVVYIAMPQEHH